MIDTGFFKMRFIAIAAVAFATKNAQAALSRPSVCPTVEEAVNVAAQTCLEADNTCASAWTAYKASPENDAKDCVTDPTKTCHPQLASAADVYTSGSPAAIEAAIAGGGGEYPSIGTEMSAVLTCFLDSPDVPGCMMRDLFEVDFNDESKRQSFMASMTCPTAAPSAAATAAPTTGWVQLLMPGFSCQPDACVNISACSLCKPPAAAPTAAPTAGSAGSGETESSPADHVSSVVAIAFAVCAALF